MTDLETPSIVHNNVEDDVETTKCCGSCVLEVRASMFELRDPNGGKTIDVIRMFRPDVLWKKLLKFVCSAWGVEILLQNLIEYKSPRAFWPAFLSHWAVAAGVLYLFLSAVCALLPLNHGTQQKKTQVTPFLIKATWLAFSIGAVAEFAATVLFWALDYTPGQNVSYFTFTHHGVVLVLILLDGLVINGIVLRLRQMIGSVVFILSYLVWTIVHALAGIGNPFRNSGVDDDDAIYPVFSWNHKFVNTLIIALGIVFVLVPCLFLLLWTISRTLPTPYLAENNEEADDNDDHETENNLHVDRNTAIDETEDVDEVV
mmetsp:Transcript_28219/g.65331  ORF Transcript_28219/g.65331 Transcript_28219/m.65331 type:complete len:315 (+) Transcript_28219:57-1001(+)